MCVTRYRLKASVPAGEDFPPTYLSSHREDRSDLVFGHGQDIFVKNEKIRQLARLDRSFCIFLESQVRVVVGSDAKGLLARNLLRVPRNLPVLGFASDVEA